MNLIPKTFFLDENFDDLAPLNNHNTLKCDIYEKDGKYHIDMDAPGYKKEDINVDFHDGYITITASRNVEKDEEKKTYIRRERYQSEYKRQFYLSNVDESKIKAKLEDGALHIIVPKIEGKIEKKRVEIE